MVELIQLVGAGGGAVATLVTVVIFLRHIKENKEYEAVALKVIQSESRNHMVDLTARLETVAREGHDVIKDNSQALRENAKALGGAGK